MGAVVVPVMVLDVFEYEWTAQFTPGLGMFALALLSFLINQSANQ